MQDKMSKTHLSEIGEFGLINHIKQSIKLHNSSTKLGIGDDAAIINYGNDRDTLVSTDMLVEGIHFDLSYMPLKHLGYKAVIVNLSDVYAMNAQPRQITVSLAISSKYTLEAIEEIYEGIGLACEVYGVDLIGGDTTSSQSGLVISVTAIGEEKAEKIVKRDGAKVNDLIIATGDYGGAYMGLQVLNREKEIWKENPNVQPDLDGHDYILERQLKPEARKDIITLLTNLGVKPTSMIDVSDGLASELKHICASSEKGCAVYEDKIPIDPTTFNTARDFELDPITVALNGGEDYELLFTIKQDDFDKVKGNPHLTPIGHITKAASGCIMITNSGNQVELKAQGWDGFKER